MSRRKKRWLLAIGIAGTVFLAGIFIAAYYIVKHFEPMVRDQAIEYLRERFHSEVELKALHVELPRMSAFRIVRNHGRGAKVAVEGQGLSMWFGGARNLPPLFAIERLIFVVDLGTLLDQHKTVDLVSIDGMQINVPPKGSRSQLPGGSSTSSKAGKPLSVLIKEVVIKSAQLVILPKDKSRHPLRFDVENLRLTSVGPERPMNYNGAVTIPKPPGQVHTNGSFGPWSADEPGDTPLDGKYTFEKADLGVFNGIAGTLGSSGTFQGTLDSVRARGEAVVPDFRLKMTGAPVPLSTSFDVLVDGTNGNTVLQPVKAKLGTTLFTTTGAVIKHEDQGRRTIELRVNMPDGDLRDLLRLAMKGSPFMQGRVKLNTLIRIPPLTGKVKEKLLLDGRFDVRNAVFLRSTVQNQIDQLSRRGRGQPENQEIDDVVSHMAGAFRLDDQIMTFRSLSFGVRGADVNLAGKYDLKQDTLDFHGSLKLSAKVSETVTGWKHWVLKGVDPLFSRHGAGTYLPIKVEGSAQQPKFGLDKMFPIP
jgi:hypothetical protein